MADLVPDDVVEHSLGREQQAPVEAHPPVGRARRPAGALPADRQVAVGGAGERGGAIQARGDLGARGAPVETLERRACVAGGHEQALALAMHARAPRLGDQLQRRAEIGDASGAGGDPRQHLLRLIQPALDPRAQLAHRRRRRALGGALGQHDLDSGVRVHVHAYAPRAAGAADGVGDLADQTWRGHRHQGTRRGGWLSAGCEECGARR